MDDDVFIMDDWRFRNYVSLFLFPLRVIWASVLAGVLRVREDGKWTHGC